jgi:low temperature requirement protein LtrA
VAALAVWTEDGLGRHYAGFAVAYLATRAVNIAQWTRAAVHVPEFRAISARFVAGFAVTAAVIAAAGRLDGAARVAVFAVAVLTDIATPLTTLRRQAALPPLSASKFPERFGLLTMIVLGESVVGVIAGLSDLNEAGDLGGGQIASGGLALLVGIGLWWLYFDFVARRPPQPRFGTALAWVYLHLVTLAAVTAIGATISVAIGESVDAALSPPVRLLLGGSVAVALLGLAALELTLHRGDDEPTHPTLSPALKAGAGIVIGAAAALDLGWTATALLAAIDVSLAVPAAYGVAVWYSPANTRARDRLAHGEAVS